MQTPNVDATTVAPFVTAHYARTPYNPELDTNALAVELHEFELIWDQTGEGEFSLLVFADGYDDVVAEYEGDLASILSELVQDLQTGAL